MDMDYIDSSFDYDVENEDFYEVVTPSKTQTKRRVTFNQHVSTKVNQKSVNLAHKSGAAREIERYLEKHFKTSLFHWSWMYL